MNNSTTTIVSNKKMMEDFKDCRRKAENSNKIFILKNNEPDAVLFSIDKYEKFSEFIEYLDDLGEADLLKLHNWLPQNGVNEMNNLKQLIEELQNKEKTNNFSDEK